METAKNLSKKEKEILEQMGDDHTLININTPLRPDAFDKSDEEKIEIITEKFRDIMGTLGLDLTDDSLKGTPHRVAKMYVKELFSGLNPASLPNLTLFNNNYQYGEMLVERNIDFYSNCEHHFVPIIGKAHVAYIAKGKVIGLSKLHRIVNHYARRPQVQERMTQQIGYAISEALGTEHVAVIIDADHLCVSMRGVQDTSSSTVSAFYSGDFKDSRVKEEFLNLLSLRKEDQ